MGVFKVLWFPLETYGGGILLGPVFSVRKRMMVEGWREASFNMDQEFPLWVSVGL